MKNYEKIKNEKKILSLYETNSDWRKVLHLANKKIITKGTEWEARSKNKTPLCFIDKGSIALRSVSPQGRERISLYIGSGCLIGETPAFTHTLIKNLKTLTMYKALEECTLYVFDVKLFDNYDFIKQYPELVYNLLESLAQKVSHYQALHSDRSGEGSSEIICKYLLRLAEKNNSNIFTPMISQSDFALTLGLHRSTVCRVFKNLRANGILGEFTKSKLEILDRKALEEYALGEYFDFDS